MEIAQESLTREKKENRIQLQGDNYTSQRHIHPLTDALRSISEPKLIFAVKKTFRESSQITPNHQHRLSREANHVLVFSILSKQRPDKWNSNTTLKLCQHIFLFHIKTFP